MRFIFDPAQLPRVTGARLDCLNMNLVIVHFIGATIGQGCTNFQAPGSFMDSLL
jgi:hypothetical protein